jgi:hypothetical protein
MSHGHCVGGKPSPTYQCWQDMHRRCRHAGRPEYKNYGARGISVCRRWVKFENFLADMGERPAGVSLDRRDNNRGYCKSNCRWATRVQQERNKRSNNKFEGLTLTEWGQRLGISRQAVLWRLRRHGSVHL